MEGESNSKFVFMHFTQKPNKTNCLLNTSEVKGWLGMRGVVLQPPVISLQKDK